MNSAGSVGQEPASGFSPASEARREKWRLSVQLTRVVYTEGEGPAMVQQAPSPAI